MPSVLWVSLPAKWKLEEVQAGLQVVIAVLCTGGIFAFSRFCWQLSGSLVKKNRAVALASLMSINTIGEAFDVITLLKRRIFRQRYWKLLAQSLVVIFLTVATITSGPIAKASTRMGSVIKSVTVPGYLAATDFQSRFYANVDWNETMTALDRAAFPLTELLDFMPLPNSTWVYRPAEWSNSTWKMDCQKTENTPVTVFDTGICTNFSTEMPAINSFFAYDTLPVISTYWSALYYDDSTLQDGLVVFTGWSYPGYDNNSTDPIYNMTFTVASLHIHNMPTAPSNDSSCQFGRGPVESASYTKAECTLVRPKDIPDEDIRAYPDGGDYFAVPEAYVVNYYDHFVTQVNTNQPVTMISPDQLIRFYQTYIITKDYQLHRFVERKMTSDIRVVQLSSTFIAFGSIYAIMVLLGLFNYTLFAFRNRDVVQSTPESKLDWIVQSILDETETLYVSGRNSNPRRSTAASIRSEMTVRGSEKARTAFENAKFGTAAVEEIPLTNYASPQPTSYYGNSPAPSHGFTAAPTPYMGYTGEDTVYSNPNPFGTSYELQQSDRNNGPELQNPESIFTSDRRGVYQRI